MNLSSYRSFSHSIASAPAANVDLFVTFRSFSTDFRKKFQDAAGFFHERNEYVTLEKFLPVIPAAPPLAAPVSENRGKEERRLNVLRRHDRRGS